jgi:glycosyltransferase involved in cell wall biosynthesis
MNNIEISVIIPAFNSAAFINRPISSLKEQSFTKYEVIIVDDGSTDGTEHEIKQLIALDNRFIYIRQLNSGPGAARNKGVSIARGNYISFLDSDDYFDESYLEEMYNKIKDENSDICVSGFKKVTIDGNLIKNYNLIKKNSISGIEAFIDTLQATSLTSLSQNKIFKRKLFIENNIKFPEKIIINEDVATIYKLMLISSKVSFVNKPLFNYVQIPSSSMNSYSRNKIIDRIKVSNIILKDFYDQELFKKYKAVYINYYLLHVVLSGSIQIVKQSLDWEKELNFFMNKIDLKYFSFINILHLVKIHKKKAFALILLKLNKKIFKIFANK